MALIQDKPMMSDREIEIINELLEDNMPQHCLEWGSGSSTIYFPNEHSFIESWLAIEHNGNYVKAIADSLPVNASVIWVPENEQWYIDCVKHSRTFDFILIDGLHREKCLEVAKQIISEDGIILLHDAGRQEYQDFIKKHGGEMLIEGEEPYNGYYKHRGIARFGK